MAAGTTKGDVAPSFKARISDLQQKARQQSAQLRNGIAPRPWHTPDNMAGRNLLDVPNLHEPAWNRDDANRLYVNDVLNYTGEPGTAGDVASLKKQIDFMAVEERAWRLRHASLPRCVAIAHGRLNSHADTTYGVFAAVQNVVKNHISAGAVGSPTAAQTTVT